MYTYMYIRDIYISLSLSIYLSLYTYIYICIRIIYLSDLIPKLRASCVALAGKLINSHKKVCVVKQQSIVTK